MDSSNSETSTTLASPQVPPKGYIVLSTKENGNVIMRVHRIKKLVLVFVGLPARGKTHLALALQRYLNWLGHETKVFNVGNYRRQTYGAHQPIDFFHPDSTEGTRIRRLCDEACLEHLLTWLTDSESATVGIYDATNTTVDKRNWIFDQCTRRSVRVLFVESICDDPQILENNIIMTQFWSPDYEGIDPEEAVQDFIKRIEVYKLNYQPLQNEDYPFVKIINVGQHIIVNNLHGYLPGKIVNYLLNTHTMRRNILLSRHGESEWNATERLGGNPPLTQRGQKYAVLLAEYLKEEFTCRQLDLPLVWTSQLMRTRQTVQHIPTVSMCWRNLNEIDAGICEGMTYREVKERYPDVYEGRKEDKLRYRYPQGESYEDVIHRLEPIILEIERQRAPILIVAHNAIIRAIYAFYMGLPMEECPLIDIPLHTVFKLTTRPYGCEEFRKEFFVD